MFKDKNSFFFFILDADSQINDKFWPFLGTSKNKKSFAREDDLKKFHASKGSLSVFNVFNDTHKQIKLIIDQKLQGSEFWSFHPQSNEFTYELASSDVYKLLELVGI